MNLEYAWDVRVIIDLVVGGVGVGAFLLAVLASIYWDSRYQVLVKTGFYTTPISVGLGLIFLLSELGRPERFITTLFRVNPYSIMSWGVFLQTVFLLLAGIMAILVFKKLDYGKIAATIKTFGAVFAIAVGIYHGLLLSTNVSRPLWNDSLLAFMFFISSLLTGSAVVLLISMAAGIVSRKVFGLSAGVASKTGTAKDLTDNMFPFEKLLGWLLVIQMIAVFTWLIKTVRSGLIAQKALQILLLDNWVLWWIGTVAAGLLVPLILICYGFLNKGRRFSVIVPIASVFILIGGYIFKHIILLVGQIKIPWF